MAIPRLIPGIPYGPAPRVASVSGGLPPPLVIVIHDTSNTASAQAEAGYAATRSDAQSLWTSCHAYVDTAGVLGSTPLDTVAWAAFSWANHHGWHIEMCGMNAGQPGAVPQVTIGRTAALVAQLCDLADIPKVHLGPAEVATLAAGRRATGGIVGHYDITVGLGVGDHDDPGPAFDWPAFIAAVNAGGNMDEIERKAGNADVQANALLRDFDKVTIKLADGTDFVVTNTAKQRRAELLAELDAVKAAVGALQVPAAPALTDAQVAALGAQVGAHLDARLEQLTALLGQALRAGAVAAANVLDPPQA